MVLVELAQHTSPPPLLPLSFPPLVCEAPLLLFELTILLELSFESVPFLLHAMAGFLLYDRRLLGHPEALCLLLTYAALLLGMFPSQPLGLLELFESKSAQSESASSQMTSGALSDSVPSDSAFSQ
eukprot:CAMPEP_0195042588 /NCGR_PEP_ID=MMETSP0347-20130606/2862_1 /TAXON_ID=2932 /ORGANISM="Alexandrium fundyense, Strain CCMP1719" /LENGTH=125 /DNA_ID=CAMNT_0040069847 /DNA_START=67 /DNA_END=442 /DNA_ORIENTATION=-